MDNLKFYNSAMKINEIYKKSCLKSFLKKGKVELKWNVSINAESFIGLCIPVFNMA